MSVAKIGLRNVLAGLMAATALAACGSDEATSAPAPGAPGAGSGNRAPTITSANSASVAENTGGTVYTVAASDPDGDTLTFAISGVDSGQFSIDPSTGDVAFVAAPDFEAPADANGDNAYTITVTASDPSGLTASQSVTITVTDASETSQRYVDQVFSQVSVQRGIEFAPGLRLDLYTPAGDTVTNRPVMLAFSGGGFTRQERDSVEEIAQAFARRGYVAATVDYRTLSSDPANGDELTVGALQAAHDMFAAVRFFRADASGNNTYGVRSDAIFVSGRSAGAIIAAIGATLDPNDTIASQAARSFLDANGGVFGNVGANTSVSSRVNGAMPLSGAILELGTVDTNSAVLFAAHEELDSVVPCGTAVDGAYGVLTISGGCALRDAYISAGATGRLFLVAGSTGHVEFTQAQLERIYADAARLFFDEVVSD